MDDRTPIDTWSFGCLLVELLVGQPLFAGTNEIDQMAQIVQCLGVPPAEWLEKSPIQKLARVFVKVRRGTYKLIPSGLVTTDLAAREEKGSAQSTSLPSQGTRKKLVDLVKVKMENASSVQANPRASSADYFNFLDLIQRLLIYQPEERMTPSEALLHPFLRPMYNQSVNTELTSLPHKIVS